MAPAPRPDPVRTGSFSSHDEARVTEFIRQTYAENRSRFAPIRGGARFEAVTHDVPGLGADRVRTSIDYEGTSEEGFSDYVFFLVHEGSVRVESPSGGRTVGRNDVSYYPLGVPVDFAMQGFDVTTVRLPAARVAQAAREATGLEHDEVRLEGTAPVSASMHRYWRSLMGLASAALADPQSPLRSPLLADDLARTLATAALHTFPNATLVRAHVPGPGAAGPASLRRATAYIESHAHLPLQLTDMAVAARTSSRALQDAFRRHLGTTPSAYLRRVRLERAREELRAADPTRGDTVAAVAARWGFSNAGRFAAAYREAYGVPPARTLRD